MKAIFTHFLVFINFIFNVNSQNFDLITPEDIVNRIKNINHA